MCYTLLVPLKPMKGHAVFFLCHCLIFISSLVETRAAAAANSNGVYIVYMGAAPSTNDSFKDDHAMLLMNSVLKGKETALVHRYRHGFSGFSARLSAEEASSIAQKPGVVSVFPDPVLQLHTTRSWDFLKYQTNVKIDSEPYSHSESDESDTIIGFLDTGIWPESESFNDKDMGPVPSRWKGTCMGGKDANTSHCNRKIIGARFYDDLSDEDEKYDTPRDTVGHGTHVAATAAGSVVQNVSYYGLAAGTAKGGSPGSRIAVYKVCRPYGCSGSAILAAFDDAVADGVHVLSISLGSSPSFPRPQLATDPIAIGAFHAVEKGITVICSAGNEGPALGTVVNAAPWLITVAATTIDRAFQSDIVLGGNKVIKGEGINFANIGKSPVHPLIYAKLAKKAEASELEARNCNPDTLDKKIIKGKIVLCDNDLNEEDGEGYTPREKMEEVKANGGIGSALIDDRTRGVASTYGSFPMTVISSKDGYEIFSYINSTSNPVATILPTVTVEKYKPAPAIAYFSARGPSSLTLNILKPDIAAPGVVILAAWTGNDTEEAPEGKKPPQFNVISGTSMAAPHVSAITAVVKSRYPTWSPSAIRSAIMTTATQTNNVRARITTEKGSVATPYHYGAGQLSSTGPLQPGLVYETTIVDYLNFLCYSGYNVSIIKLISKNVPDGFSCLENSTIDLVSNINYPSIAISNFGGNGSRKVNRTVTNVAGDGETVYSVSIEAPAGIEVQVIPEKMQFKKDGEKLTYQVIFSSTASLHEENVFGAITWANGKYKVRSPFVVTSRSTP